MAEVVSDVTVNFDILNRIILEDNVALIKALTDEERREVNNVVTLLNCDCTKKDSLKNFENVNFRQKQVTENELDQLASKTSAQSTTWAVVVIVSNLIFLTKHDKLELILTVTTM